MTNAVANDFLPSSFTNWRHRSGRKGLTFFVLSHWNLMAYYYAVALEIIIFISGNAFWPENFASRSWNDLRSASSLSNSPMHWKHSWSAEQLVSANASIPFPRRWFRIAEEITSRFVAKLRTQCLHDFVLHCHENESAHCPGTLPLGREYIIMHSSSCGKRQGVVSKTRVKDVLSRCVIWLLEPTSGSHGCSC